jgi:hypothetical protein
MHNAYRWRIVMKKGNKMHSGILIAFGLKDSITRCLELTGSHSLGKTNLRCGLTSREASHFGYHGRSSVESFSRVLLLKPNIK